MHITMASTRNDTSRIANAGVDTGANMLGVGTAPAAIMTWLPIVLSLPSPPAPTTATRATPSGPRRSWLAMRWAPRQGQLGARPRILRLILFRSNPGCRESIHRMSAQEPETMRPPKLYAAVLDTTSLWTDPRAHGRQAAPRARA